MEYIPKDVLKDFRQKCTSCRGFFDKKKFEWMCEGFLHGNANGFSFEPENSEEDDEEKIFLTDREKLNLQRLSAAKWMINNFSREQRYLIVLSRDLSRYLDAFSADKFKSAEKKESLRWDFYFDYKKLSSLMKEYRWSKKLLLSNGIDFVAVRNLFFTLFTAQEIAS